MVLMVFCCNVCLVSWWVFVVWVVWMVVLMFGIRWGVVDSLFMFSLISSIVVFGLEVMLL